MLPHTLNYVIDEVRGRNHLTISHRTSFTSFARLGDTPTSRRASIRVTSLSFLPVTCTIITCTCFCLSSSSACFRAVWPARPVTPNATSYDNIKYSNCVIWFSIKFCNIRYCFSIYKIYTWRHYIAFCSFRAIAISIRSILIKRAIIVIMVCKRYTRIISGTFFLAFGYRRRLHWVIQYVPFIGPIPTVPVKGY